MGGVVDSAAGFLGLGENPSVSLSKGGGSGYQLSQQTGAKNNKEYMAALKGLMGKQNINANDVSGAVQAFSDPNQQAGAADYLFTDPALGSRIATGEVQNNPMLGQLFGQGGTLDRTNAEEQRLASQGFQLTPEDHEAYGQASGNIARLFGSQENDLAKSLASRGLSAGASGAAGAQFSGLQGNKYEQLAKAQTDIANQRMNNTMQRLGQTRQFLGQMAGQGAQAINDQYARQSGGVSQNRNALAQSAGIEQGQQSADNAATMSEKNFEQANKPKNFMDFATAGVGQGIQSGLSQGAGNMTSTGTWQTPKKS